MEGPSWNSALVAPKGIQRPTAGNAGRTVYSTAVIQTSTPTTAAIWLRTRAPIATPMTPYAAITANPLATTPQKRPAAVTSPSRERISTIPNATDRASVAVVTTTLVRASDIHFATRTRVRRGSPR